MFLVSDDFGDFKEIMNYKQLKEFLIAEIEEDILNWGTDDIDVIKSDFKIMKKLTEEKYNLEFIKKELESCGWFVQDLSQMERGINNLREFYARSHSDTSAFDKILDLLYKGVK